MATPRGPVAIESIAVGDAIRAFDEDGRRPVVSTVVATPCDATRCWIDVIHDRGAMRTTRRHPVWVESKGRWLDAVALTEGMTVLLHDGALATVRRTALRPLQRLEPTFNLLVDRFATYFAGAAPVLVHNGTPLNQVGHNVYVLSRNGQIYYVGRFGPNESAASVVARHSRTPKNAPLSVERRFVAGQDRIRVLRSNLTYAEARRLEHEVCVKANTYRGRGSSWRGNRDYPMSPRKFGKYYARGAC